MEKRTISFRPPDTSELEIAEVAEALRSGWITTGPRTKLLERRLALYIETGKTDYDTEVEPDRWINHDVWKKSDFCKLTILRNPCVYRNSNGFLRIFAYGHNEKSDN